MLVKEAPGVYIVHRPHTESSYHCQLADVMVECKWCFWVNGDLCLVDPYCMVQCLTNNVHAALRWRHNGSDSVSNHQPRDCLPNRLFRRRWKKASKLRDTGLCAGNSPGTGEFPTQMASYAENLSIWWRHHGTRKPCAFVRHGKEPTMYFCGAKCSLVVKRT